MLLAVAKIVAKITLESIKKQLEILIGREQVSNVMLQRGEITEAFEFESGVY